MVGFSRFISREISIHVGCKSRHRKCCGGSSGGLRDGAIMGRVRGVVRERGGKRRVCLGNDQ